LKGPDHEDYIRRLDGHAKSAILLELCADAAVRGRVMELARAALSNVDPAAVSDDVFAALEGIDVTDLWERSGETYGGYSDPTEVVPELVEEVVASYAERADDRHALGLLAEERALCVGIIRGLLRYEDEGANDFHDWAPDDPREVARHIAHVWERRNPDADAAGFRKDAGL
jgi:hypothetical protein